jgi:hypothetical protein
LESVCGFNRKSSRLACCGMYVDGAEIGGFILAPTAEPHGWGRYTGGAGRASNLKLFAGFICAPEALT